MQMLSAESRRQQAIKRLNASRRWATGLLLTAALLFIAAAWNIKHYAWLAYVKAFAEAAMVGALADWFAVTALFRRPLSLPIPHTAILPRNQARIADELARFIEHNFLQDKPIAVRIYQAKPAERLLAWLSGDAAKQIWLPWAARQVPLLLKTAKPEQAARFVRMMLEEQYDGKKMAYVFSDGLVLLKANGLHDALFERLIKQLRHWLQSPDTRALLENNLHEWAAKIESDAPSTWDKFKSAMKSTLVEKVDDWAAAKVLDWADGYLAAVAEGENNALKTHFERQYDFVTEQLKTSAAWHARLESAKVQIANAPLLEKQLMKLWQNVLDWAEHDAAQGDSKIRAQLEKLLAHMAAQAEAYPQFMRRADLRISLAARSLVAQYKNQAAVFVADKVKSWDSAQMTEKLELSVGKDLQYIRINGTLVGGLAGLLIYCVSEWITG